MLWSISLSRDRIFAASCCKSSKFQLDDVEVPKFHAKMAFYRKLEHADVLVPQVNDDTVDVVKAVPIIVVFL